MLAMGLADQAMRTTNQENMFGRIHGAKAVSRVSFFVLAWVAGRGCTCGSTRVGLESGMLVRTMLWLIATVVLSYFVLQRSTSGGGLQQELF